MTWCDQDEDELEEECPEPEDSLNGCQGIVTSHTTWK